MGAFLLLSSSSTPTVVFESCRPLMALVREVGSPGFVTVLAVFNLIYTTDAKRIVQAIGDKASHPNCLELWGNKLLAKKPLSSAPASATTNTIPPLCACSSRPVMSVVTINRVQDVYSTPVYQNEEGAGDLALLDTYLHEGRRLNWAAYAREVFPSVHIGLLATTTVKVRVTGSLAADKHSLVCNGGGRETGGNCHSCSPSWVYCFLTELSSWCHN